MYASKIVIILFQQVLAIHCEWLIPETAASPSISTATRARQLDRRSHELCFCRFDCYFHHYFDYLPHSCPTTTGPPLLHYHHRRHPHHHRPIHCSCRQPSSLPPSLTQPLVPRLSPFQLPHWLGAAAKNKGLQWWRHGNSHRSSSSYSDSSLLGCTCCCGVSGDDGGGGESHHHPCGPCHHGL